MRILYFILKVTLNYSLRAFYPRRGTNNPPKRFLGRTIYVSNHAASFMDPLVVASLRMPIVFFMTRSDVFNPITKPILWACQMLPIYRQHDGQDTKGKNEAVFRKCTRILKWGRNLLIFGEGFTDDTFIRRLKPVKKGAARIGFSTLEAWNWNRKIYMCGVGVNYSRPNQSRSDVLISHSDRFCLNDYKEMYLENPSKAINEVTKRIEKLMQEQITHVEKKELAPFHEDIMKLTRRGMNPDNFNRQYSVKQRWRYSQDLAKWLNEQDVEENEALSKLRNDSAGYFKLLKRFKLEEKLIHWKISEKGRGKEILLMILLFPFMPLGVAHLGLPYLLTKRFVEKSFKRKVFWGSVKVAMGKILMGLLNLPIIWVFYYCVYPSWWAAIGYYFAIGLFGIAAYEWFLKLKDFKKKGVVQKTDISKFVAKREDLISQIQDVVPKEFH